jgi:8-oxo-dGTP diphosphatase
MPYTYKYPRPALTTEALIISRKDDRCFILLIERKFDPYKGFWALPGGFVNMDEDLVTACARELEEETGITGVDLVQFETFGAVNRDPRGRTVSVVFWAETDTLLKAKGSDDAARALWFLLEDLPQLAFDHQLIIDKFIKKTNYY